ncbi:MAG: class B sortase [Clostridiales bacterium]|nr:class B sortase [Clostridiales bacterium]
MRKKRNGIAWLILTISICGMAIAGYKTWETLQVYREANESYGQVAGLVRANGAAIPKVPDIPPEMKLVLNVDVPGIELDFEALQAINADAVAWLYCPDTVIDYPVMKAADYSYYLRHLPDGKRNSNGSLFIDYNCAPDFSDELTIIYGHRMKSGRMFGSLMGYKKQAYFEQHPFMFLYTERENYRIDLMFGCVISVGTWREQAFVYQENLDALLSYAAEHTTFTSETEYSRSDKIIVLSTCSYEFKNARYVVIGVLQPEYLLVLADDSQ